MRVPNRIKAYVLLSMKHGQPVTSDDFSVPLLIMLGCIETSSLMNGSLGFQIPLQFKTQIFTSIVTTENLNLCIVLTTNHFMKILK